jgi:hypothetical protein
LELELNIRTVEPPREFEVGYGPKVKIKDCAHIDLAADEQVTFHTKAGAEYDLVRKDWGFYATPSLNGRLARFGLRSVLVKNRVGLYFLLLVEQGQEASFERYVEDESLQIITWMETAEQLAAVEKVTGGE